MDGLLLGGNVGGAWSYKSFDDPNGVYFPNFPGQDLGWHSAGGFAGGAQVGCDYQIGSWVIGGQGMFNWANLKGNNQQPAGTIFNQTQHPVDDDRDRPPRLHGASEPAALRQGRRRLGEGQLYAVRLATASLLRRRARRAAAGPSGAGFEQMFAGSWSWFAEYNYLNFGTHTVTFNANVLPAFQFPINVQQDMHMVLVGVNYRFGPGARYI